MRDHDIRYSESRDISRAQVLPLYEANVWSSADKPDALLPALQSSHSLVTAWRDDTLVGLGNAISDGHLVVYYPHLLVHPDHYRTGIGSEIMRRLMHRYEGFHQHVILADRRAVGFYKTLGFTRAGQTEPLWVYAGDDH